jgi:DNA-binding NtrC family response regulator
MQRLYETVRKVAQTDASVIFMGETGSGKDVLAYYLHTLSRRRDGPFTIVDSGALSDALLESELFGHVKGAFTGALTDRQGLIETALGGSLFLNEISEASQALQLRLLHLLQYKTYRKVGGPAWDLADVRFIAASNKDLSQLVSQGKFREDLYHRLKVVEIRVPPLRERPEDLPGFIEEFIGRWAKEHARPHLQLSPCAFQRLVSYRWPGNIRELEHCIEYLVVTSEGGLITGEDVSRTIWGGSCSPQEGTQQLTFFDGIKDLIEHALRKHRWNKSLVADELGIDRSTLYRRMKKYGISPDRRAEQPSR